MRKLKPLFLLAILVLIWAGLWQLQRNLSGTHPNQVYEAPVSETSIPKMNTATPSANLAELRRAASEDGKSIDKQVALARGLLSEIRRDPTNTFLIFEAIDTLRSILNIDVENKFALINMAELASEQGVMDKAVNFFEKYLALEPEDWEARTDYASVLALTGKQKEALTELNKVTSHIPDNFKALAYIAIAHMQLGEKEEARKYGELAKKYAPSEEAAGQMEKFLGDLNSSTP